MSDNLKDALRISFKHIPTQRQVYFRAFLENFTDTFDAEWSSEKVFGRMDPIAQYKGTSRKISCGFTIPSESHEQAYINHRKISLLIAMMYPAWEKENNLGAYTISAPPLMEVKFNNLISSRSQAMNVDRSFSDAGLLGFIPTIKYEPDMNSPIFIINKDTVDVTKLINYGDRSTSVADIGLLQGAFIGYQSLKLNFELNVLHTHRMGIHEIPGEESENKMVRYPYGFNILRPFRE